MMFLRILAIVLFVLWTFCIYRFPRQLNKITSVDPLDFWEYQVLIGFSGGGAFLMIWLLYCEGKEPKAIDVYREKTELKITKTVDSSGSQLKADTVVVWK